jgi:VWFA-related protein
MPRPATRTIVLAMGLLSSAGVILVSQTPPSTSQAPGESPRFRVGVDAVRIDAVVTDRDGRTVPNLTAADFEVRQDGKLQSVTLAQFMPVLTGPAPSATVSRPRSPTETVPVITPPTVKREEVQRTIALVVDDLGLSFTSFHGLQKSLHAFVDRELRPGDLVAIVRTGGAGGGLQPFTMDRRVLHSVIDGLRWHGWSRSGVEPFEAINSWETFSGSGRGGEVTLTPTDFNTVDGLRSSMSSAGTLGALNLVVRGARELPGRKAIIFVSDGFQILEGDGPESRARLALDRVVEQATRSGVVIYALDARGLQAGGIQAEDNIKNQGESGIRDFSGGRNKFLRDTQEGLAYLAEQTGGFAVMNTNDLAWGLGRITNDVRDYYVIGYSPSAGTFAKPGQKPSLHKISIKVNRPGLRVKTRKEFLGISDPPETARPTTPAQQLIRAATSPFAATDIALRATALPGYSPEQGTFVRALLHIDARPLTFVESEGGKKAASVDVLGMVFDQDGTEVAHLSTGFTMGLAREAAEAALGDGIAYMLRIPIPRAGAYQVRFAVRDQQSGMVGSAGEFVEMGNIAGGAFALSGIVLRPDDGSGGGSAKVPEDMAITAAQALSVYRPGTRLSYAYEIYNAATPIQASTSVWRGTEKVLAVEPATLVPPPDGARRFAAAGGVKLGEKLPPGGYVLQIAATRPDPQRKGKTSTAVQRIAFEVR